MEKRAFIQWAGGGLAAASFGCLIQILTLDLDKLSPPLKMAVLLYAIAIPLDVFIFLAPTIRKWEQPFPLSKCVYAVLMISFAPITIAGFAAVFWHFSIVDASIFLGITFLCVGIHHWIGCDLRKGRG